MNISKLADKIKDYKIIGFGECAHWVNIIQKYRIDLFKELHKRYNWNYFFYEGTLYESAVIDAYINGFISKPKPIYHFIYHPFRSDANLKFIDWCRKRNEKLPLDKRIHILGWDCQKLFRPTTTSIISKKEQIKNLKYLRKIFFPKLDLIKIDKYYERISKISYDDQPKYSNTRDRNSYYIIKQFIHSLPNNEKLYLVGHNTHLHIKHYDDLESPKCIALGYYLNKYYNYLSIGSDILTGKVVCNIEKPFAEPSINHIVFNGENIIKRKEKQKNKVRTIVPNNTTKHIICSEMTEQFYIFSKEYHHLIIRFEKDTPWTENKNDTDLLRF